jgi:hypothetical protein
MIARTIRKVATGGSAPIAKTGIRSDETNTKWIVDKMIDGIVYLNQHRRGLREIS